MEFTDKNIENIANTSFTLLYNTISKGKDPIEVFPVVQDVLGEIMTFTGKNVAVHPNLIRYSDALEEVQPEGLIREALLEMFSRGFTPNNLIRVMSCGIIHFARIGLDFEETIKEYTGYENLLLIMLLKSDLIDLRDNVLSL